MNAAVELDGVTAGYGGAPCLRDVSLRVEEGGLAALLGPNGAGKSTLLRVITGRHRPSAGAVRLFGRDVARLGAAERAALVALAPQELTVPLPFTVEEVVAVGRTARRARWSAPAPEDRRAMAEAMRAMDVWDLRERPFDALSGGERQRAIVAMALAQEPRLLLLDEPTSHLDLSHRLEIFERIERRNAECGLTVLLTSHDINLAAEYCRRLFVLDRGRLAAAGTPEETLREPLLRDVYRCDLRVRREPDGAFSVRPVRRAPRPEPPVDGRFHGPAGGG